MSDLVRAVEAWTIAEDALAEACMRNLWAVESCVDSDDTDSETKKALDELVERITYYREKMHAVAVIEMSRARPRRLIPE